MSLKDPPRVTQERLKELLHYDPETGIFIWKVNLGNKLCKGKVAGNKDQDQGIRIKIDKVRKYPAHHLAWLYMTGFLPIFPRNEVDHINRIRSDNSWKNLRLATRKQNSANRTGKRKVRGVRGKGSVFEATCHGKHLGTFKTEKEAAIAYNMAAIERYGEFAVLNIINIDQTATDSSYVEKAYNDNPIEVLFYIPKEILLDFKKAMDIEEMNQVDLIHKALTYYLWRHRA